jgi:hypothetical protein
MCYASSNRNTHATKERIELMGKFIRILIAIVVVLSFVIWAKSDPAGAANPESTGEKSLQSGADLSVPADQDDCQKGNNKDKEKCKCKENGKPKKHCGTVKPPDDDDDVCERGKFSVGGVAVLDVKELKHRSRKDDDDCFHVHKDSAADVKIPNAGKALSDRIILSAMGEGSAVEICFAATPGKSVKIFYTEKDSWTPLDTRVENGVACARAASSGSFVLAGR